MTSVIAISCSCSRVLSYRHYRTTEKLHLSCSLKSALCVVSSRPDVCHRILRKRKWRLAAVAALLPNTVGKRFILTATGSLAFKAAFTPLHNSDSRSTQKATAWVSAICLKASPCIYVDAGCVEAVFGEYRVCQGIWHFELHYQQPLPTWDIAQTDTCRQVNRNKGTPISRGYLHCWYLCNKSWMGCHQCMAFFTICTRPIDFESCTCR